jgi:hypothetical protein
MHKIGLFLTASAAVAVAAPCMCRGFTRKEPYANHNFGFNWTPKAENWNGRIAMLGFTGMLLTEVRGSAVAVWSPSAGSNAPCRGYPCANVLTQLRTAVTVPLCHRL